MREVNEALEEAVQIRLATIGRNIPGANNGFGVQPTYAAHPAHAGAGFDDQVIHRQFNQQAAASEALIKKAEQVTKTLLQDAKTQENQICGVMDARANGGVRLVEGPGGKHQKKEWEAVPSVDEKGRPLDARWMQSVVAKASNAEMKYCWLMIRRSGEVTFGMLQNRCNCFRMCITTTSL